MAGSPSASLPSRQLKSRIVRHVKTLWWLFLAAIPFLFDHEARALSEVYKCPAGGGKCYEIAALVAVDLEHLTVITALFLWPACIWFLFGRRIASDLARRKSASR